MEPTSYFTYHNHTIPVYGELGPINLTQALAATRFKFPEEVVDLKAIAICPNFRHIYLLTLKDGKERWCEDILHFGDLTYADSDNGMVPETFWGVVEEGWDFELKWDEEYLAQLKAEGKPDNYESAFYG